MFVVVVVVVHVTLTEFIQLAQVDLLSLAVGQVGVKCGAHQSKPSNLGCL